MSLLSKLSSMFKGKKKPKGKVMPHIDSDKRFDLVCKLGQGSMSQVWRARDRKLGIVVCLKVLNKEKTDRFEARFMGLNRPTEGLVCVSLRHQNVVRTFEYGVNPRGEQCLVMELIEGSGLNFLIETKNPKLNGKRFNVLEQLCDGLEFIHNQGYVHRDICPRNIMLTTEGFMIKFIDFGLSIPNQPQFRRPGNRTGTPNYMAPELIRRTTTDHRVDMFALGVTAYELFTGALPWDKSQSLETLLALINSRGKNPLDLCPDLDKQLVTFLMKAIERDPRDRFQTPAEFREALKALPKRDY